VPGSIGDTNIPDRNFRWHAWQAALNRISGNPPWYPTCHGSLFRLRRITHV